MKRILPCLVSAALSLLCPALAVAADWPTWRYDMQRTAASPQELADVLHLHWVRDELPLRPAWPDQPRMQFDAVYEPIVVGQTLFLASSRTDSITALDTRTGAERWRFHADGPIRFAPLVWEGKLYCVSDDGYLYCLECGTGALLWKFRGGPSERKILGNDRLIATWPARGAPVVADGTIYFAAGIWPFMGVFLHALDARTGRVVWTNDGDSALYIKQPHNADAFAGVAPQGVLAVQGTTLLVPGGRSVPACYDRTTGKLLRYPLAENGKRGGADVAVCGTLLVNHGSAYELATQTYLGELGRQVVLTDDVLHTWKDGACRAFDLGTATIREVESKDRKGDTVKAKKWLLRETGACKLAAPEALLRAGSRLYAALPGEVVALRLPLAAKDDQAVVWRAKVAGTPAALAVADDRLFVATREGRILCYGPDAVAAPRQHARPAAPVAMAPAWATQVRKLLGETRAHAGYGIVWGIGTGGLVTELARQSRLHLIVLDPDTARVARLRQQLVAAGLYGSRVAVLAADPATLPLPPYLASLLVSEEPGFLANLGGAGALARAFAVLRPYGGAAAEIAPPDRRQALRGLAERAGLAGAVVRDAGGLTLLVRDGPLPGAANWTHEHADAANTRVARDRLVKAPLGLLWFGGPPHDTVLPRHGHGPQPQVVDGRLIIEGVNMLRAVDIYTGRLLWETTLLGVGKFYDNTLHQPGANASGTNYISTPDGIYVAYGKACLRLDPATGQVVGTIPMPVPPGASAAPAWGYLNVCDDVVIGGGEPVFDAEVDRLARKARSTTKTAELAKEKASLTAALVRFDNDNHSASKLLTVFDRQTGKPLWSATARAGFRHNALCAGGGRLYCIDRLSGAQVSRLKRRGEEPALKPRLVVFDLHTGQELWSTEEDVFGTWLSYSAEHDILVESGRVARDTMLDEPKGMRAYRADRGTVLWYQKDYVGPAMLHGDTILKDRSACDLRTGAPRMRPDPLTGQPVEWTWTRTYGCNTPAASEHLLTFRSGAAGFLDYCHDGGTGNLGGFRSSCTNNLIVAGGLLNAPDYTRTCTCSYQNQCSLALVHMPEAELWTFFGAQEPEGRVRRIGLNLGAPGDRRAEDGTLWLEYPSTGGPSPAVTVRTTPARPDWFRRHASQVTSTGPAWVAASGARGLTGLTVTLAEEPDTPRSYTVRLHFLEPDAVEPGQRVFDVSLQGRRVLEQVDIVQEAGGRQRGLVKECKGIRVLDDLVVALTPRTALPPVLCGIEIVIEED